MITCAWCGTVTDKKKPDVISHGMCSPCSDQMLQDNDIIESLSVYEEKPIDCCFEALETDYFSLTHYYSILPWLLYLTYLIINL